MDPDSSHQVLLLIMSMSLLGFRDAARTSVLSRIWRNVWRQTGNVEVNERYFSHIQDEDVRRVTFVSFVENWMANYVPRTMDKFVMIVHNPIEIILLAEQGIQFAINHGVRVLGLDFSNPAWGYQQLQQGENPELAYDLPPNVHTHQALESLTLHACSFNPNAMTNFSQLKQLTLGWMHLPLPTLSMLLQNFPLLETLALKNCWNLDGIRVVGQGLRLKTLLVEMFMIYENTMIEIVAPNLRRLKYFGDFVVFDVMAGYLEDVCVEFGTSTEGDPSLGDCLYELLRELSSSVLTVCTYMLQVLPLELGSNGVMPRLGVTKLTLKTAMLDCEQLGVQYFLKSCHYLETLIIQIVPARIINIKKRKWVKSLMTYGVLLHLKYIISRCLVITRLHIVIDEELRNLRGRDENYALVTRALRGTRQASRNLHITVYC